MARPMSEDVVCLMSALVSGPGTTRDLAARTGLGIAAAREALNNMVRRGDAIKGPAVRVRGVKRPVPVYARGVPDDDGVDAGDEVVDLIACWAMLPAAHEVQHV